MGPMRNAHIAEGPYPTWTITALVEMIGNIATTVGQCGTAGGTSGADSWWASPASNEGDTEGWADEADEGFPEDQVVLRVFFC